MIKEMIATLTLEEKAVLLSGKTVWETFGNESVSIPSIFLADGPHGLRKQEGASDHLGLNKSVPATCFPTAATVANSWDVNLAEEIGRHLGKEAKANGVEVLLGPGLNIKRNPLAGRNFEYFSEDPYLSGKMAAAYIRGIQKNGTIACPKHFAVNNQELRRMASDSIVDTQTLREIYLTGFEIAVKEGKPLSLMSAYNKVNGVYANESQFLLRDVLIEEWGFEGFVVSDWGGDNDHVEAVKNGAHLQMPSTGFDGPLELVNAVKEGRLKEEVLDERVGEYLRVILKTQRLEESVDFETQHNTAHKAAAKSIVLLKNEDNVLPLNSEATVGVIGDFAFQARYQGAGSSVVNPKQLKNTVDVIDASSLNIVGMKKGFERQGAMNDAMLEEALELAKASDVVLVYIGLDELAESEGDDRRTMKIAGNQIRLLEALGKIDVKVVAIISAGCVIDCSWEHHVDAILHGYLSGEAGASAMLDVISGKVNPSGKLNETYPITYEDVPFGESFPEKSEKVFYKEGLFVGYRYYDKIDQAVRYPFGYGLSYTQFEYGQLTVEEDKISFTIKNVGNVYGEEVAQLYVSHPSVCLIRPKQELKGFVKVGLQPQEEQQVTIPFDEYTFRFFNPKTNRWETEPMVYGIKIGASSRDIRLESKITLNGEELTEIPYEKKSLSNYFSGNIKGVLTEEFEALYGKAVTQVVMKERHLLGPNHLLKEMAYAKSPVARFIHRTMENMLAKSERKGTPDLNLVFQLNMPFRAIAKMTNGMVNMKMVHGMLEFVNGKHLKGLTGIIKGYFWGRKVKKAFEDHLTEQQQKRKVNL